MDEDLAILCRSSDAPDVDEIGIRVAECLTAYFDIVAEEDSNDPTQALILNGFGEQQKGFGPLHSLLMACLLEQISLMLDCNLLKRPADLLFCFGRPTALAGTMHACFLNDSQLNSLCAVAAVLGVEQPSYQVVTLGPTDQIFQEFAGAIRGRAFQDALASPPSKPRRPSEQLIFHFWRYAKVSADGIGCQGRMMNLALQFLKETINAGFLPHYARVSDSSPCQHCLISTKSSTADPGLVQERLLEDGLSSLRELHVLLTIKIRVSLCST